MGGKGPDVQIPAVLVDEVTGLKLKAALDKKIRVDVTLRPYRRYDGASGWCP